MYIHIYIQNKTRVKAVSLASPIREKKKAHAQVFACFLDIIIIYLFFTG